MNLNPNATVQILQSPFFHIVLDDVFVPEELEAGVGRVALGLTKRRLLGAAMTSLRSRSGAGVDGEAMRTRGGPARLYGM